VIEPSPGLFIAAVPFLKMLDLPGLPKRARFVAQVLEGAAKPVGGDSEGTVRIVTAMGSSDQPDVMLFYRFEPLVLGCADLGLDCRVEDLLLDLGMDREFLDHLLREVLLGLHRAVAGLPELLE
jgi:hypothetical protein